MAAARKVPGIIQVHVDVETQRLLVRYDAARTSESTVVAAIRTIADNIE